MPNRQLPQLAYLYFFLAQLTVPPPPLCPLSQHFISLSPPACSCMGMCYCLWRSPSSVPPSAPRTLSSAASLLPHLLAARLRAQCCHRMGRRFDAIMRRMPQAVVCVHNHPPSCIVNHAAAAMLGLPRCDGNMLMRLKVLGLPKCGPQEARVLRVVRASGLGLRAQCTGLEFGWLCMGRSYYGGTFLCPGALAASTCNCLAACVCVAQTQCAHGCAARVHSTTIVDACMTACVRTLSPMLGLPRCDEDLSFRLELFRVKYLGFNAVCQ